MGLNRHIINGIGSLTAAGRATDMHARASAATTDEGTKQQLAVLRDRVSYSEEFAYQHDVASHATDRRHAANGRKLEASSCCYCVVVESNSLNSSYSISPLPSVSIASISSSIPIVSLRRGRTRSIFTVSQQARRSAGAPEWTHK